MFFTYERNVRRAAFGYASLADTELNELLLKLKVYEVVYACVYPSIVIILYENCCRYPLERVIDVRLLASVSDSAMLSSE